jgi:hypothetical protein
MASRNLGIGDVWSGCWCWDLGREWGVLACGGDKSSGCGGASPCY